MFCGKLLFIFLFLLQNFKGGYQKEPISTEKLLEKLDRLEEELEKSCTYVKNLERERQDIQEFEERLEKTEDEMREVQRGIESTQSDIYALENQHAEESNEHERKIRTLVARVEELEDGRHDISRFANRLRNLEQLVDDIRKKVQAIERQDREVVRYSLPPSSSYNSTIVYFSAFTTKVIKNYEGYIGYDHVEANYGNGLNKYTGKFTAPVAGLYLFTFHAEVGEDSLVVLRKNHKGVIRTLSTDEIKFDEAIDKQLKIVTTLELRRGDEVGCYTFDKFELRGNADYGWDFDQVIVKLTVFQGYLLRQS